MKTRYLAVTLLVLLAAIALSAALVTANAGATTTYDACRTCHGGEGTHTAHGVDPSGTEGCGSCHNGSEGAVTPSGCASCHPAVDMIAVHPAEACTGSGCHSAASPSPSPSPTDDADGDIDAGDEEAEAVAFPTTGYPPSDGGSSWLLLTGVFAAGLTVLLAAWRFRAASRRHN